MRIIKSKDGRAHRRSSLVTKCVGMVTLILIATSVSIIASRTISGGDTNSPTLASSQAVTACDGQVNTYSGLTSTGAQLDLIGAYSSTAGLVTTWDENRPNQIGPNSVFSGLPSEELVSVCYFSGDFTGFPGPPGAPTTYRTIVVVVQPDGSSMLDFAGPATLGFSPPQSVAN